MISSTKDLEPGMLFTTNGKDVWEVESFCEFPTVSMKNVRTAERTRGAVGSPILENFVPLTWSNKK